MGFWSMAMRLIEVAFCGRAKLVKPLRAAKSWVRLVAEGRPRVPVRVLLPR
jgi:hypothetical protein